MPNNLLVAAFICRAVTVRSDWSVVSIFDPLGTSEPVKAFNHAPAMEPQVSTFAWLGNQVGWTGRLATTAPGSTTLGEPTAPFTDSPSRAPLVLIFVSPRSPPYFPPRMRIGPCVPGPFRDKFLSLGTEFGLDGRRDLQGFDLVGLGFSSQRTRSFGVDSLSSRADSERLNFCSRRLIWAASIQGPIGDDSGRLIEGYVAKSPISSELEGHVAARWSSSRVFAARVADPASDAVLSMDPFRGLSTSGNGLARHWKAADAIRLPNLAERSCGSLMRSPSPCRGSWKNS